MKYGSIGRFGCALCLGMGIAAGAQADPLSGRGAALGSLAGAGTVPTATGGWLADEPRATYATRSVRSAARTPGADAPSGWSFDVHFVARFTQQREVQVGDARGRAAKVKRGGVADMARDIEDQMGGISLFPFGSVKYTFRF